MPTWIFESAVLLLLLGIASILLAIRDVTLHIYQHITEDRGNDSSEEIDFQ